MAIQTTQMKENVAIGYGSSAAYASLHSASPGTTGTSEISGGAPAYARKALTWTAGTVDGTVTASVTFDVPSGTTVAGAGIWSAVTAGTYLDGASVTSQAFATQGTYTLTLTFTAS